MTMLSSFTIFVVLGAAAASVTTTKYQSQNLKETIMVFYVHELGTGHNVPVKAVAGVPKVGGGCSASEPCLPATSIRLEV